VHQAALSTSGYVQREKSALVHRLVRKAHDQLQQARICVEPIPLALKLQQGILNDIHRRLCAASKKLEKPAS
jgi:hypothetical protein